MITKKLLENIFLTVLILFCILGGILYATSPPKHDHPYIEIRRDMLVRDMVLGTHTDRMTKEQISSKDKTVFVLLHLRRGREIEACYYGSLDNLTNDILYNGSPFEERYESTQGCVVIDVEEREKVTP